MGSARLNLNCHPDTPARATTGVTVAFERNGDALWLRFMVDVPEEALLTPGPVDPERTDGLWKTTCFEAFLKPEGAPQYIEYNLAPSSQWAAYAFDDYREGSVPLDVSAFPAIGLDCGSSWFALEADLVLPALYGSEPLHLALSAVIEEADGTKSYWALRHPPGQPDFHHPDCFALTLEAPDLV